jgi:hypothetical protein
VRGAVSNPIPDFSAGAGKPPQAAKITPSASPRDIDRGAQGAIADERIELAQMSGLLRPSQPASALPGSFERAKRGDFAEFPNSPILSCAAAMLPAGRTKWGAENLMPPLSTVLLVDNRAQHLRTL